MEIKLFFLLSSIVLSIFSLLGSAITICLYNRESKDIINSFSSGSFYGLGLAFLLAHAFEVFGDDIHYPVASAVCIITFVIFTLMGLFYEPKDDSPTENSMKDDLFARIIDDGTPSETSRNRFQYPYGDQKTPLMEKAMFLVYLAYNIIEGMNYATIKLMNKAIPNFLMLVGVKAIEMVSISQSFLEFRPKKSSFWLWISLSCLMPPVGTCLTTVYQFQIGKELIGFVYSVASGAFLYAGCNNWGCILENKEKWTTSSKVANFSTFTVAILIALSLMYIKISAD